MTLKGGQKKSKKHHLIFKMAVSNYKTYLLFIVFFYYHLVVGTN